MVIFVRLAIVSLVFHLRFYLICFDTVCTTVVLLPVVSRGKTSFYWINPLIYHGRVCKLSDFGLTFGMWKVKRF